MRCNLACAHCYSSSSPQNATRLEADVVARALEDAAQLGYLVASFSGGEPLLYSDLPNCLAHAKTLGFQTAVTTNGFFLDARHLDFLRGRLDLLAISVDGDAAVHNAMRRDERAYRKMTEGLAAVRASGIPFGFIHTLTPTSWETLESLVAFAVDNGARLFQIHPLEAVGRGAAQIQDQRCDELTLAKAYLLAAGLRARYGNAISIQLDLLHCPSLAERPSSVYGEIDDRERWIEMPPSELIGVLVLEAERHCRAILLRVLEGVSNLQCAGHQHC